MSTERRYIEVPITITGSDYVANVPVWVNAIVDAAPDLFSLSEVVTNTSSSYAARIRISDTPIYLYIYNSSDSAYISIQALANGSYIEMFAGQRVRYGLNPSYPNHMLYISAIGDFAVTLVTHNTTSSHYAYLGYCRAYAEDISTNLHMCYGAYSSSTTIDSIITTPWQNASALATFREDLQQKNTFNLLYPTDVSSYIVSSTNYTHTLTPILYAAHCTETNGKAWTGRLLWDGKYGLYRVNVGSNAYPSLPARTYVVNGTEYLGCFTQLFVPIEIA